jgi:hypothetical protein
MERIDEVLARWQRIRQELPVLFTQLNGEPQEDIEHAQSELNQTIPDDWKKFLRAIGKCDLTHPVEFVVPKAVDLPKYQEECREWFHEDSEPTIDELGDYLFIGNTWGGDMYALDISSLHTTGDCPVVLIDHEVQAVGKDWNSLVEMLEEFVTRYEKIPQEHYAAIRKKGEISMKLLDEIFGDGTENF